jgi:hypothetical protein
MEHPLIGNLDELGTDELGAKISELQKKLNIASRSGNAQLCNQIRMALENYQNKYDEKMQELYERQLKNSKMSEGKIDIQ